MRNTADFYGYQDFDLNVQKTYEKGCILNQQNSLVFLECVPDLKGREAARPMRSMRTAFMKQACVDREYGGVILVCHLRRKTARYNKAYVQSGICNLCAVYVF